MVCESDKPSEYLCTLQPRQDSALGHTLGQLRTKVHEAYGVDVTSLYPPHISVSGFFTATEAQVAEVCEEAARCVARAPSGSLGVWLKRAFSTEDGHVLVDVAAPGVTTLSNQISEYANTRGCRVRPKAVKHLSLASKRSPEEQQGISAIYHQGVSFGCCRLDLVIARVLHKSDVETMKSSGKAHAFEEVLRVTLPSPVVDSGSVDAETIARHGICTPTKRNLRTSVSKPSTCNLAQILPFLKQQSPEAAIDQDLGLCRMKKRSCTVDDVLMKRGRHEGHVETPEPSVKKLRRLRRRTTEIQSPLRRHQSCPDVFVQGEAPRILGAHILRFSHIDKKLGSVMIEEKHLLGRLERSRRAFHNPSVWAGVHEN